MIKLNIKNYCHECIKFEPEVTDRPETHTYYSEFDFLPVARTSIEGDTIVRCMHREICEHLCNFFKK